MSKMRGGGPEKRRAVPKKERHGSLFLYRDNQTTRPRTHLGSITQLWWRWGIGKVSHWERDSCRFNPLLCLRIVPSSGVFVRRQISMCAAFVRLPLYTRPTSTYKALVSLWQNIAKMVSWWSLGMEWWHTYTQCSSFLHGSWKMIHHSARVQCGTSCHQELFLTSW